MKRPQSAKPGYKGYWGQMSSEDIGDQSVSSKNPARKNIKIMKPDLTTHDFARILPKKIHQDKERLYSEALQLKQTVNELMEQNMRLKTKMSILEKEKDKMNRYIDSASEAPSKQVNSRLNIYGAKSIDKENMMVRNLKKIIRESRDENEYLKGENQKIKKTVKYTKINEIQIQKKIMLDENKRLSSLLEEYNSQIINQDEIQRQNQELKKYLEEQIQQNKELGEENDKFQEIVESLEDKLKTETDKYHNKEKRVARDLQLEKRKTTELQKYIEDLRKEIKTLQGNAEQANMKKKVTKPAARPMSSHPSNYRSNLQQPKQNTLNVASKDNVEADEIKRKNQVLEKELNDVRVKLQQSEKQLNNRKLKDNFVKKSEQKSDPIPVKPVFDEKSIIKKELIEQPQKGKDSSRLQKKYDFGDSPNKQEEASYSNAFEPAEESYSQQFDKTEEIKVQAPVKQTKQDKQIQMYKKDFEEEEEEEELYKKDESDAKKQNKGDAKKHKKDEGDKKKKKEKGAKNTKDGKDGYKADKKMLSQIKELLTYRMKSQRYPFQDLKVDIQSAQSTTFSYSDLCNMLVNEPFYLTSDYTKAFLSYCYEKEVVGQNMMLTSDVLIPKLRKVVEDFELMDEAEEKEMIMRIAEMTSTYPYQLETAFENIKNGEDTVGKADLFTMFQKLELEDRYIELIVAELSLCSDDLEHLNFHGFFQRFYIEEQEGFGDPNAIEQQVQESEESNRNTSRIKKKSKNIRKPSDELQQKMGNYMLAPEQPIQNRNYAYDEDIVSDDGRI